LLKITLTRILPVTQIVTNFEPKTPLEAYLHGFGWRFCSSPAVMHSWAVMKCDSMPRICLTVPTLASSVMRSVKIQPIYEKHEK